MLNSQPNCIPSFNSPEDIATHFWLAPETTSDTSHDLFILKGKNYVVRVTETPTSDGFHKWHIEPLCCGSRDRSDIDYIEQTLITENIYCGTKCLIHNYLAKQNSACLYKHNSEFYKCEYRVALQNFKWLTSMWQKEKQQVSQLVISAGNRLQAAEKALFETKIQAVKLITDNALAEHRSALTAITAQLRLHLASSAEDFLKECNRAIVLFKYDEAALPISAQTPTHVINAAQESLVRYQQNGQNDREIAKLSDSLARLSTEYEECKDEFNLAQLTSRQCREDDCKMFYFIRIAEIQALAVGQDLFLAAQRESNPEHDVPENNRNFDIPTENVHKFWKNNVTHFIKTPLGKRAQAIVLEMQLFPASPRLPDDAKCPITELRLDPDNAVKIRSSYRHKQFWKAISKTGVRRLLLMPPDDPKRVKFLGHSKMIYLGDVRPIQKGDFPPENLLVPKPIIQDSDTEHCSPQPQSTSNFLAEKLLKI